LYYFNLGGEIIKSTSTTSIDFTVTFLHTIIGATELLTNNIKWIGNTYVGNMLENIYQTTSVSTSAHEWRQESESYRRGASG